MHGPSPPSAGTTVPPRRGARGSTLGPRTHRGCVTIQARLYFGTTEIVWRPLRTGACSSARWGASPIAMGLWTQHARTGSSPRRDHFPNAVRFESHCGGTASSARWGGGATVVGPLDQPGGDVMQPRKDRDPVSVGKGSERGGTTGFAQSKCCATLAPASTARGSTTLQGLHASGPARVHVADQRRDRA